jgi:acetyl esterase/lipase
VAIQKIEGKTVALAQESLETRCGFLASPVFPMVSVPAIPATMKLTALLFSCLVLCVSAFAQTEKIALWSGPAPGTEGRENTEKVDANGNISQVFQPELTYFPAPDQTAPAPAILVCPGGGYRNVVMQKEGVRVAQFFQKRGFAVFVLKYRLVPSEAVQDARRAMRIIRQQAAKNRIDPAKFGVVGFSAGGHLSASLALNFAVSDIADETDKVSARPDFCAPIYGVLEPLNPANYEPGRFPALYTIASLKDASTTNTPPMFLAHAVDDKTVPVEQSLNFFIGLKAKGIPVELHLYEKGDHGFALDPERGYASSWGEAFILWLKAHGVEGKAAGKP